MAVMVAQGAVGYIQYFTHLPALLVEVHILGATLLVIGAVQTFLACTYHAPEAIPAAVARRTPDAECSHRRPLGWFTRVIDGRRPHRLAA